MSQVKGCQLNRVGDLPFDFDAGACGTFNFNFFPVETILLCFDDTKSNACHT